MFLQSSVYPIMCTICYLFLHGLIFGLFYLFIYLNYLNLLILSLVKRFIYYFCLVLCTVYCMCVIVTGFQLKCDLNMLSESWLNQMNNIMHNNNE